MSTSRRPKRVAQQIQHEISHILARDLKDRRVGMITVTGVDVSPDLRHARVFVSIMGKDSEKDETMKTLRRAAGWIRHELGQRIRMKFLPEIVFTMDTSQEYGEKIDRLLDELKHE